MKKKISQGRTISEETSNRHIHDCSMDWYRHFNKQWRG